MTSRTNQLEIIAFCTGAVVMILEIVATRLFAPHVGTSLPVWTSIIGVILASLSLGYWLGGHLADRELSEKRLSQLLFAAAAAITLIALIGELVMSVVSQTIPSLIASSLLGSIALLSPASLLLASTAPYITRLRLHDLEHAGATIGRLSAISTVGSIAGTFFAGFFLIGLLGTHNILIALALIVLALSLIAYYSSSRLSQALLLALLIVVTMWLQQNARAAVVADIDTDYNRIIVSDIGGVRYLQAGGLIESAMDLSSPDLISGYTQFYRLVDHFRPGSSRALMLGGAGYVYPRDYLTAHPTATIDVVEIDPGMTEIAKKYFNLKDDPGLTIIHEDARTFINKTPEKYDAIFGDAFGSWYSVPYQLTTLQATKKMRQMLSDNGVLIVNLIGPVQGSAGKFIRAYYHTVKAVFPHVFLLPLEAETPKKVQNIMLVALASEKIPPLTSSNPEFQSYLSTIWEKPIPKDIPILTDDFAPVDQYVARSIK